MYNKFFIVIFVFVFLLAGCSDNIDVASGFVEEIPEVTKGELDTTLSENSDLVLIQKDDKFGLIDLNGDIVLDPKFEDAGFKSSTIVANYNKEGYIVLKNGKEIKLPFIKSNFTTFDTSNYILYHLDSGQMSFVNCADGNIKTIKRSDYLKSIEEIVYMSDEFFVSKQISGDSNLFHISDYNGSKIGESYSEFFGSTAEKPKKMAFGNADTVFVMNEKFQMENTFSGMNFNFITNENYILYKNEKEIQYIDSSGNVLNTFKSEFNIETIIEKPYNFVIIKAEDDLYLTNIFGDIKIDKGFKNIEVSEYNGKRVLLCKTPVTQNTTICSMYDIDGRLIKTYKFLEKYDILKYNDEYAVVRAYEDSTIGIIDILQSTEKHIIWLLEVGKGNVQAFLDSKGRALDNLFLITKESDGDTTVGLYNAEAKKYVFTPIYTEIKSVGNGLYYLKTKNYEGISTYNGDFRYVYKY